MPAGEITSLREAAVPPNRAEPPHQPPAGACPVLCNRRGAAA